MNRDKVESRSEPYFSRAKVTPPATSRFEVPRDTILDRVHASSARVALVHAPAGFGKTTLMTQLRAGFQAQGAAIIWLSLDQGDNDVSRFLAAFAAAVETIPGPASIGARPTQNADVALWIMDRIAAIDGPAVIFFDDMESLHNPIVTALIGRGLESVASHVRIVIGSRNRPDVGLARLGSRGELVEVDANDLRFSSSEAQDFLMQRRGLSLSQEQLSRLLGRTEGWAAALWLASLALERRRNPTAFLAEFSGSNAAIASYLSEDVLVALPETLRAFVLRCSVLDELSPVLCDAVCGIGNSRELLRQLEQRNLFIHPLDGQHALFRFHGLFRDFLGTQLQLQFPAELRSLHVNACRAYLSSGRPIPAIQHALRAGAMELALQLLYEHVDSFLSQGRLRLVGEWLGQLPEAELSLHPRLKLIYAWCIAFMRGPEDALRLIAGLDAASLPEESATSLSALRPMLLAMSDRIEEAHRLGLENLSHTPAGARFARAMLCQALAQTSIILGEHEEALRFIDEARGAQRHAANAFGIALAQSAKALLDLMGGRLKQAAACMTEVTGNDQAAAGADRMGNAVAAIQLAEILYESNQCEAAQRLLFANAPLIQEVSLPDALITAHVIQSRIADQRGDYDRALDALNELETNGYRLGLVRAVASARLERTRLYLGHGDAAEALAQLTLAESALPWTLLSSRWYVANDTLTPDIARLRWMIRTGDAENAVPLLRDRLADSEVQHRARRALKLRVLLAEGLHACGERKLGLRTLARAQHIAQPEGFLRTFLEEGPVVQAMLREIGLRRHEDLADPAPVAARMVATKKPEGTPNDGAEAMLDDPLTHKELQVLSMVAQGCRNTTMAERLFVSESTVRTHLRNINLKLHAANRTEAAVIARRLGLIT